jgi:hypothetical protein
VFVVETECTAAVHLGGGIDKTLLHLNPLSKLNGEHITTSLQALRGALAQGKFYRVTFEEIPAFTVHHGDVAMTHHEP